MLKRTLIVAALTFVVTLTAVASSDREDDVYRTQKAAQVFKEIMDTPDQGVPQGLLESAKCIAIIPGTRSSLSSLAAATAGEWLPVAPQPAGALPCLWRLTVKRGLPDWWFVH